MKIIKKIKELLVLFLFLLSIKANAFNENIKVMEYSLDYLNGTSSFEKLSNIATITISQNVDLLIITECLHPNLASEILNYLNVIGNNNWAKSDFLSSGYFSQNGQTWPRGQTYIFYNASKLQMQSNEYIPTFGIGYNFLKDIIHASFLLRDSVIEQDPTYIDVYGLHWKSGNSTTDVNIRTQQAILLAAAINQDYPSELPNNRAIVVTGDFNSTYGLDDHGIRNILGLRSSANLFVPIASLLPVPSLHYDAANAFYHTYSTESLRSIYDHFVVSDNVISSSNLGSRFSYTNPFVLGNDGKHYAESILGIVDCGDEYDINCLYSDTLINRLNNVSDHLPIIMTLHIQNECIVNRSLNDQSLESDNSRESCYYETSDKYIFHSSCIVDEDIVFDKEVVIESGKHVIFRGNPSFTRDLTVKEFATVEIDNTGSVHIDGTLNTEKHSSVRIVTNILRLYRIFGGFGGSNHSRIADIYIEACTFEETLASVDLGFDIKAEVNINGDLHLGELGQSPFATVVKSYSSEPVSIYSNNTLYVHGNTEVRGQYEAALMAGRRVSFQPFYGAVEDIQIKVASAAFAVYATEAIRVNNTRVVTEGGSTVTMEGESLVGEDLSIWEDYVNSLEIETFEVTGQGTEPIFVVEPVSVSPRNSAAIVTNETARASYTPKRITFTGETFDANEMNFNSSFGDKLIISARRTNITNSRQGSGSKVTTSSSQIHRSLGSENRNVINRFSNTSYRCCEINRSNVNYAGLRTKEDKISLEKQEITSDQLRIYPNPTDKILHIKWTKDFSLEKVVIYNIYGNKVVEELITTANNDLHTLHLENLRRGVYFLNVFDKQNNLIKTDKIILTN